MKNAENRFSETPDFKLFLSVWGSGHALRPRYWMVLLALADLSIRLGRLLFFDRILRGIRNFMAPLEVFSTQSLNKNNFWQT